MSIEYNWLDHIQNVRTTCQANTTIQGPKMNDFTDEGHFMKLCGKQGVLIDCSENPYVLWNRLQGTVLCEIRF